MRMAGRLRHIFRYISSLTLFCVMPLISEVHASTLLEANTYFDGFQFWTLPVTDTRSCAMACTRFPLCMSFNFDLYSRTCELNRDVLENHTGRRVSKGGSVYSRIKDWSTEVCYYINIYIPERAILLILVVPVLVLLFVTLWFILPGDLF